MICLAGVRSLDTISPLYIHKTPSLASYTSRICRYGVRLSSLPDENFTGLDETFSNWITHTQGVMSGLC